MLGFLRFASLMYCCNLFMRGKFCEQNEYVCMRIESIIIGITLFNKCIEANSWTIETDYSYEEKKNNSEQFIEFPNDATIEYCESRRDKNRLSTLQLVYGAFFFFTYFRNKALFHLIADGLALFKWYNPRTPYKTSDNDYAISIPH